MSTFETMQNPTQGSNQGFQLDESKFKLRSRKILGEPEIPTMIRFLVSKGFVKTENQAVGLMLGLCLVIVASTVFIFKSSGVQTATFDPTILQDGSSYQE